MPYATVADMVTRFGEEQIIQLSDRTGAGIVDETVVEQAIADAGAVVDGHLAGRYAVPLNPAPDIVVGYVCDLARRNLYTDDVPKVVEDRARDAIRFLERVGEGKLLLGAATEPEPAGTDSVQVIATDRRRYGIGL